MIAIRHCPIPLLRALTISVLFGAFALTMSAPASAQAPGFEAAAPAPTSSKGGKVSKSPVARANLPPHLDCLPVPVTRADFADLREHSPFLRTLNLSRSLILTGVAQIEEETIATLFDFETRQSYVVSGEASPEGWQLVEVQGDRSDLETLTARIKIGGAEVVSIRYQEAPKTTAGSSSVTISTRIGDGTRGGGTGPHGGPDPRVLTPDQLADARNAARNIKAGFQADGYRDNDAVPPAVVQKVSQLSVQQRESINVKMFEHRNRGLGLSERQKIYNGLLDRELRQR